jgi:hypothetical protein
MPLPAARPLRLAVMAGLWPLLAAFAPQEAPDLMAEFEAACVTPRGAAAGVEAAALARGYAPVESTLEEEAGSDRADPPPRVWARGEGDDELRVVSAPGRMRLAGPWLSVDRCYVSGPGDFTASRAAAARLTGVDSFRQRQTAVFAWTETPEGRQAVRQSQFERGTIPLLRDRGLQMVLVSETRDGVTLSYVVAAP